MLKSQVQVGGVYAAKISGTVVPVRLDSEAPNGKGWQATNLTTNRTVRIRTAAKLRYPAVAPQK